MSIQFDNHIKVINHKIYTIYHNTLHYAIKMYTKKTSVALSTNLVWPIYVKQQLYYIWNLPIKRAQLVTFIASEIFMSISNLICIFPEIYDLCMLWK